MPTAVVTGASSGIGLAVAKMLVDKGYEVIGTSRDAARVEPVAGIEFRSLDLAALDSIEEFAAGLPIVDLLINNAGESQAGALEEVPWDALQRLFDCNVLGAIRLTQLVLPGMRAQRSGRIVMVGSMAASFPMPYRSSYSAAKAAIRTFSDSARLELRPFGIEITTVEPGSIRTGISTRRTKYVGADSVYRTGFETLIGAMDAKEASGIPAEKVAATIIEAAEAKRTKPLYAIGSNAPAVFLLKRLFPGGVVERIVARQFGIKA
ncbi:MAG: SDR family oxidoreductase [Marmoricola sp.]